MTPEQLKSRLSDAARKYAAAKNVPIDTSPKSAVLFCNLADAFHHASYLSIAGNPQCAHRLQKSHQRVSGFREMQSSNSSDALLMNVFCHPQISTWGGVRNLLGFDPVNPQFGIEAHVAKLGEPNGDATEIDMAVADYFIEAKLTEADFTDKDITEVNKYTALVSCFDVHFLPRNADNTRYKSYQIIRNLLAAIQHDKNYMLICDAGRSDLVRDYWETVSCLKDIKHRKRCRVVFWQEIAKNSGKDLKDFLESRYGIV